MELDKNNRIKNELERLISLIQPIDANELAAIYALLQNAAFMAVTLQDLQETINQNGVVEQYVNGANQSGMKPSSALKSYNAILRNYTSTLKSILPYVIPEKRQKMLTILSGNGEAQTDVTGRTRTIFDMLRRAGHTHCSWNEIMKLVNEGLSDEDILRQILEDER